MNTGFNGIGKPITFARKQAAYDFVKSAGVDSQDECLSLVNSVSDCLERDKPFEAQATAMKSLDLTGAYRLMATLLT